MAIDDEDISGEDIVPLLHRPNSQALIEALVHGTFYLDDPDDTATILRVDPHTRAVQLRLASGRTRSVPLASGYVLMTPALAAAIAELRTPADAARDKAERALIAFGFRARVEEDDRLPLLAAVEAAQAYRLPWREDRFEGLRLARKYGTPREEARLAAAWLEGADDPPPGDLVIALVSALRESGRSVEAIPHTELVTRKASGLDKDEMRILLIQRGNLWLDRYELGRDAELLERARQCARRSWAIEPSEQGSALYNRIRKLED